MKSSQNFVDSWSKIGSRVFFPLWRLVGPSQDGERGERLTNTPFGAKDGGRHRQERALVLTSLCEQDNPRMKV